MNDINWDKVPRRGGVYCLYDLDGKPVYVGEASESDTRHLAARLREHFTQQNSSVVAHGRIDLLAIWYADIWTTSKWELAEDQLIAAHEPVFNRGEPTPKEEPIDIDDPDETLYICGDEERKTRLKPQNRIRAKMDHIQRMIDSDQVALRSLTRGKQKRVNAAKNAADYHLSILESAIAEHYDVSD